MGGTGQWAVLAGDPPDGTETGVQLEIQAKVSSVLPIFQTTSQCVPAAGRRGSEVFARSGF